MMHVNEGPRKMSLQHVGLIYLIPPCCGEPGQEEDEEPLLHDAPETSHSRFSAKDPGHLCRGAQVPGHLCLGVQVPGHRRHGAPEPGQSLAAPLLPPPASSPHFLLFCWRHTNNYRSPDTSINSSDNPPPAALCSLLRTSRAAAIEGARGGGDFC